MCGISQSHVSEIESGVKIPSIEMIENICNSMHIHPFELMSIDEK